MDVEVISLADSFFRSLGMSGLTLKINSLGCPECRKAYREALKKFLEPLLPNLCKTCQGRFEGNPLRILDCKEEGCKERLKDAPKMLDYQDEACASHFEKVKDYLSAIGLEYVVDPRLVRGLDYYTRTVFEFITTLDTGEITVCGGGRYDNLVEEMGGQSTPAAGFGLGIERLLLTLQAMGIELPVDSKPRAFIATMGDEARVEGLKLLAELRHSGIPADTDYSGKSLKAQMKLAGKLQAEYAIILGEEEVAQRTATVRDMRTKEQRAVRLNEIASELSKTV
jgi:histidyl-tRNA synthetase